MIDVTHIIVVDRGTDEELNAVHQVVKAEAKGWWHRFTNVWLVGGRTTNEWRDALQEIIRGGPSSVLVLRLPKHADRHWSYFGPKWKERCEWIHNNYRK